MNQLVESIIASKLRVLTLEQVDAYVAGNGSLAVDLLNSRGIQDFKKFLIFIRPEDFQTDWARQWFRQNRPDLWKIFSTPKGGKWLDKTCFEIRMNLRRLQNP